MALYFTPVRCGAVKSFSNDRNGTLRCFSCSDPGSLRPNSPSIRSLRSGSEVDKKHGTFTEFMELRKIPISTEMSGRVRKSAAMRYFTLLQCGAVRYKVLVMAVTGRFGAFPVRTRVASAKFPFDPVTSVGVGG